jgi:hypothetical protein
VRERGLFLDAMCRDLRPEPHLDRPKKHTGRH